MSSAEDQRRNSCNTFEEDTTAVSETRVDDTGRRTELGTGWWTTTTSSAVRCSERWRMGSLRLGLVVGDSGFTKGRWDMVPARGYIF